MFWFIYYVIFVIFIVSLAYYKLRYPFVKQINEIVGPDGLPIVGMAYQLYKVPKNKQNEFMGKLFKEFGPVFRTWIGTKGMVHIASAEYAQKILSSPVNIEKSSFYQFVKPWLGSSLPFASGEEWHKRRKLLTPAFHFSFLNDCIDIMVKNCRIFTQRLEKEVDAKEFDIFPYTIDCTVDTIAETAMSVQLNSQKGSARTYAQSIYRFTRLFFRRIFNPFIHFDFVYSLTKDYSKMKAIVADLHRVSSQIVEQRVAERYEEYRKRTQNKGEDEKLEESIKGQRRKTFIDILLNTHDKKDGSLTLEMVREEVDAFMFAGYDTISVTIAFTIFLVGHHPEVQDKIQAELDALIPADDSPFNTQTITQLKYLEWTILETLRLYPPTPTVARYLKEPVILGDHTIPAGTDVAIYFYHLHRSAAYFSNPNKFDPLNFSPERVSSIPSYAFIPFSAGPRNCIGQKFARLEAKIALALFFKKYKVTSVTKVEDMKLITEIIARPQHGVHVKIERRNGS